MKGVREAGFATEKAVEEAIVVRRSKKEFCSVNSEGINRCIQADNIMPWGESAECTMSTYHCQIRVQINQ